MSLHEKAFHVEMKGNQNPKYHPVRADGTRGDEFDARWKAEKVAQRWRDEHIGRNPHETDAATAAWKRYQDRPRKQFEYSYKNTKTGQFVTGTIASDHILEAEAELDEMFSKRGNAEGGGSLTYQNHGVKPVGGTRQKADQDTKTGSNITVNPPEAAPVIPPSNQPPPLQPPPGSQPPPSNVPTPQVPISTSNQTNASQSGTPPQPSPPAQPPAANVDRPMWGDFHSESDLEKIEKYTGHNPFAQQDHRTTFADFHTASELNKINPNPLFGQPTQASQQANMANRPEILVNFNQPRWRGGFGHIWGNGNQQPPQPPRNPPVQAGAAGGGGRRGNVPISNVPAIRQGGAMPPSGTPPQPPGSQPPGGGPPNMPQSAGQVMPNQQKGDDDRNKLVPMLVNFTRKLADSIPVVGKFIGTIIEISNALSKFADQTLESNRKYAAFSGNLGNFGRLDINDFNRQRRVAAGTGESTKELIHAMDNMREKFVKWDTATQNIQNRLATMVANAFADDKLGHIADSIDSMLSIGVGPFINAIGVGLMDVFMGRGGAKLQKAFEDYTAALVKEGQRKEAEAAKIMNQIAPFDQWLLNMRNNAMPLMRR